MSQPERRPQPGPPGQDSQEPIIFTGDQLPELRLLAEAAFHPPADPRSPAYVRVLKRPKIRWLSLIAWAGLPLPILAVVGLLLSRMGLSPGASIAVCGGLLLVYLAVMAKPAAVCAVRLYQHFAPDSVRNRCRFEPSCSEYMILSIEKYGLFKGVKRGIGRLRRCNVKGGGFDEP